MNARGDTRRAEHTGRGLVNKRECCDQRWRVFAARGKVSERLRQWTGDAPPLAQISLVRGVCDRPTPRPQPRGLVVLPPLIFARTLGWLRCLYIALVELESPLADRGINIARQAPDEAMNLEPTVTVTYRERRRHVVI